MHELQLSRQHEAERRILPDMVGFFLQLQNGQSPQRRLPVAPMEALYTALQGEIQSFQEHTVRCQQAFDIHTLYNVLLLLLPKDRGRKDIRSLEQLGKLVESREWEGQDITRITAGHKMSDIPSYISWFISYVRYLGSLKEAFDTKVVFPLSENLYVNDDPVPPDKLPFGSREGHATASIAHIAKQLFALRRKWALLLKGGTIDERVFSSQSLLDLRGFAGFHPFVKILRLVPDLFHKSLASAELARQWVELHASRYSSRQVCSNPSVIRKCYDTGMAVSGLEHQPGLSQCQQDHGGAWPQSNPRRGTCTRSATQGRNKLNEVRGELMSLLWREERSWTLEAEIRKVNQRISSLQIQREDTEGELAAHEHPMEKGSWRMSATQRQEVLRELDALESQLRLEGYRKNILQGDWLLELELQERCQELASLWQEREETPKDLPPRANGLDSHSSHSSVGLNTLSSSS